MDFGFLKKRVKNERIVNEFDLSFLCEFRPLSLSSLKSVIYSEKLG
jgi:hypothetical protein